jgi:hypothetical protein
MKYNVWCVMLNDAILVVSELVWNPSWLRLTTGIIWAQVQKFERFGRLFLYLCSIIWSVLLQGARQEHQHNTITKTHEKRPQLRYMRWNNKATVFSITSHDEDMALVAERCATKWQVSKELQFQCDCKAQSQYQQTTVVSSNFNATVRHKVDIHRRQSWCTSSMEHI